MRNKRLWFWVAGILLAMTAWAGNGPQLNSDEWYLIRFMNGGNAFTATADGAEISTTATDASDGQLWKIIGNEAEGYTITNKKGLTLYAASGVKNDMIKASAHPSGDSKFRIVESGSSDFSGGWEIQPFDNAGVSMNLWGGPSENRGVGLWDKNDKNNPVTFTSLSEYESAGKISVIPYPQSLTATGGKPFDLGQNPSVFCLDEKAQSAVTEFAAVFAKASGIELTISNTKGEKGITLEANESLPAEGYSLASEENGIRIQAATPAGFFYALQTLKQLLPREVFSQEKAEGVAWTVPAVQIEDHPVLGHRGFMMDVARHFFTKEEVKRTLDIMALYKMNRFHWHLTDDQGWRVEIPEYPLLTEVGAVRSGSFTSPGDGTKFFDDTEYGRGMYFTLDDLREIVAYAKERHIEIMPEIDMPGHMVAAVTAYPVFSCDSTKQYSVRLDGGISKDVLNIGDDRVIDFLKCVLDHMAEVFPYPYIHIGGDECPTDQWTNNADCLQRVKEEGLAGVHELQSWLVEELGTYLKTKHGKDIVVWDELLNHWNSDNSVKPVIMAWNNISKSRDAANKGFKSIVVPYQALYLDFMQVPANQTLVDEPYYGGWGDNWVNTLEDVYALNPLSSLAGKEDYCMGVQGNLWAETLNDFDELQYQLLPRMLALSEIGWLENGKKSWDSFHKRLQRQDEILDALGYIYAKHYIQPDPKSETELLMEEAGNILAESRAGKAGYPKESVYQELKAIYEVALTDPSNEAIILTLKSKLDAFKSADIVQPAPGKVYQIVSASTYYKKQFAGSTLYQKDKQARFHYTPQTEPEELWAFVQKDGAEGQFYLQNLCTGEYLSMPTYNAAASMTAGTSTAIRMDKATVATGDCTYRPGVVTLSAVNGYSADITGSVKRLSAQTSGLVYAKDDAALCYSGTWTLEEIEDFRTQLEGLVKKCEAILRDARPGKVGEPTENALAYLKEEVCTPAQTTLAGEGSVSQEAYLEFVARYNQFLAMPRTSAIDAISEDHYYLIQNAYFTDYYATCTSTLLQPKRLDKNSDNAYWQFVKNEDGTVTIISKKTERPAYVGNNKEGQMIYGNYSGKGQTAWTLEEVTTDMNASGIAIVDASGKYSWYTNPDAFANILLKPKDWGASIWNLIQADAIPTGIDEVTADSETTTLYDLSGRRVKKAGKGIYINGKGEKIMK